MKFIYIICCGVIFNCNLLRSQALYFPPLTGTLWETTTPQSLGWCQERIDSLYNYLQVKNTKSFIVLKNGKIVLEKYFGTYTGDSVFYWASASKSLAGFIAGVAQQNGFININNPVSQYLGTGWSSETPAKESLVRVKDLLQMTSGLEDNPPPPCDNEDSAKACLIYKVDAANRWAYHTGAYKKVQSVVSAAAGLNYNLITNNWIKTKTGMSGLWIDQTYYSKARDMARFGLLTLNKGTWNGDSLMKDQAYFNAMITTSQSFNPSYGYLWWLNGKSGYLNPGLQFLFNGPLIPNAPADMYCALGKNDQKIYVVPSNAIVVIRQGNSAEGVTFALSAFDNKLWDYINKLSCSNVSLFEKLNEESISIYPNPAATQVTLKSSLAIISMKVSDLTGSKSEVEMNGNSIDVSELKNGLYFLQVNFLGGKSVTTKLIIDDRSQ